MPKTPDFIINMKQPPRSAKHGHRRPSSKNHGSAADRASAGARRTDAADAILYAWARPPGISVVDPGAFVAGTNPRVIADAMKLMQHAQEQMIRQAFFNRIEPKIPHEGVVAGEIIGYRLWWTDKSCNLRSINQDHIVWVNDAMTGDVDKIVYRSLMGKVRYAGIYAFKTLDRAMAEFTDGVLYVQKSIWDRPNNTIGLAVGSVKLWGEVVEHTDGYRAELAKIHMIEEEFYFNR